jgi:hypothetical protein
LFVSKANTGRKVQLMHEKQERTEGPDEAIRASIASLPAKARAISAHAYAWFGAVTPGVAVATLTVLHLTGRRRNRR